MSVWYRRHRQLGSVNSVKATVPLAPGTEEVEGVSHDHANTHHDGPRWPGAGAAAARAQVSFEAPENSLSLEETGTLESPLQGTVIKFRDKNKELWLLKVDAQQTQLSIEGEADLGDLRPGMTVELDGKIDETGKIAEPVESLTVLDVKRRPSMGLFSPDDAADDARPLRNPAPGSYHVRGKIKSVKDREITIAAGRIKVTCTAGEEFQVKLNIKDVRMAQPGDTMQVKAWYIDTWKPNPTFNTPGQAMAESLTITLSKSGGKEGK